MTYLDELIRKRQEFIQFFDSGYSHNVARFGTTAFEDGLSELLELAMAVIRGKKETE